MKIKSITPQIRTNDMASSVLFYTQALGCTVEFNYEDLYVGLRSGDHSIPLIVMKRPFDPYVEEGGHLHLYFGTEGVAELAQQLKAKGVPLVKDVHETAWQTREFIINDDQGHTLYFGEPINQA